MEDNDFKLTELIKIGLKVSQLSCYNALSFNTNGFYTVETPAL